jgi:predicted PurR-regulated permease PerM
MKPPPTAPHAASPPDVSPKDDGSAKDGGVKRTSEAAGDLPDKPLRADNPFAARLVAVVALVVALWLAWTWRHALLLALISVLIALGLLGMAATLRSRVPIGPKAALASAALILLGLLSAMGWLFGAQLSGQVTELADRLPGAVADFRARLEADPLGARFVREMEALANGNGGTSPLQALASRAGGVAMALANGALNAILVIVAAVFFAIDPAPYRAGVALLAPKDRRAQVCNAMDATGVALQKWMLGTIVSMLIIALIVGTGLTLLGVPAPFALALIAGLSQLVPVIGPIVSAVPGVLLALTVSPDLALWTLVVYLVASQLEANVITPLVQKRAVSLPPALTIFAIAAMGILFGPLGVVLAPPLALILMVVVTQFYIRDVLGEDAPLPGQR